MYEQKLSGKSLIILNALLDAVAALGRTQIYNILYNIITLYYKAAVSEKV